MSHSLFQGCASSNTRAAVSRRTRLGVRRTPWLQTGRLWAHGPCRPAAARPGEPRTRGTLGPTMIGTLLLLVVLEAFGRPALARTRTVRCNQGETLTAAIAQAAPGDTLRLTGHCRETVLITTDDLTLTSTSGAIIDGQRAAQAVLTIDGARRMTLQGVTVQNGLYGVHVRRSASVSLMAVTATGNADQGLRIEENSTASLEDCTVENNTLSGIFVQRTSSAIFRGTIRSQNNGGNGFSVANTSHAIFDGATFTTQKNNANGIDIREASSVRFTNNTRVVARQNQLDGFLLLNSAHATVTNGTTIAATENDNRGFVVLRSASLFVINSTLEAAKNENAGIIVSAASMEVQTSTVTATENGAGIVVSNTASLLVGGALGEGSKVRAAENIFRRHRGGENVQCRDWGTEYRHQ